MFFTCSLGRCPDSIWWFIGKTGNLHVQDGWNAALIAASGASQWENQDWALRWLTQFPQKGLAQVGVAPSHSAFHYGGCRRAPIVQCEITSIQQLSCDHCWVFWELPGMFGVLSWYYGMSCRQSRSCVCVWQQCPLLCLSAWLSFQKTMGNSTHLRPCRCVSSPAIIRFPFVNLP